MPFASGPWPVPKPWALLPCHRALRSTIHSGPIRSPHSPDQRRERTVPPAEQARLADCLRAAIEALPPSPPLYCLVGALAVNAWGRIRTTQDIDLLVLSQE